MAPSVFAASKYETGVASIPLAAIDDGFRPALGWKNNLQATCKTYIIEVLFRW
ncbi:MAG: hypothetical protein LBT01_03895 [Spirochaetaceae bacterium]|nr:hypothetical protein [Spirochaetaceae bacterium]